MLPQAFPRQLVRADRFVMGCPGAKTIAIEHFETLHLPALEVLGFGPETNRYAGHSKIQIRQISQLFPVSVAPLDYHAPSTTSLFGHRVNLERIDESRRGVGQRLRNDCLCQTYPIFPSWHRPS